LPGRGPGARARVLVRLTAKPSDDSDQLFGRKSSGKLCAGWSAPAHCVALSGRGIRAATGVDSLKADEIFLAGVEKSTPAERTAFLDGACQSDVGLRAQVEGLLKSHDAA